MQNLILTYKTPLLWFIFVSEVIGSVYGYYWYKDQLSQTPWYLWIFTCDCPIYSTLFSIWLYSYILKRSIHQSSLFTTLTWTGLAKYGLWTVVIVQDSYLLGSPISFESLGLQFAHAIMFIQGVILMSSANFRIIVITILWMILNDYMGYNVGTHPWILPEQVRLAMWLVIGFTAILSGILLRYGNLISKKNNLYNPIPDSLSSEKNSYFR